MRKVYLDYASLTPVDKRVMKEVRRASSDAYANPSAIHGSGVAAKNILEASRATAARFLRAHADEIFFTASGTEANNIAIRGVVGAAIQKIKTSESEKDIHILVSAIEHASVLETVKALAGETYGEKKEKVRIDFIPVTADGIIDLDIFKKMLRPETALVSIMTANNEIGTIQPIREAVKIVRDFNKTQLPAESKILFHTDACQAPLYLDMDMEKLGVDLLTLDSNKVYGPRGVGSLYKRRSVRIGEDILPVMTGGGQESGLRPGTENVPAIAGFAKALEIAAEERGDEMSGECARLLTLRDYFVEELTVRVPYAVFNGSYAKGKRLVNNINVTFPVKTGAGIARAAADFDHEFFLLELDARGVSCSTKSACLRDEDESYVLRAVRAVQRSAENPPAAPAQSIRFSFGRATTKKDIDYTLKMIDEVLRPRV